MTMDARFVLAQINVARFREPRSSPVNADFEASLDRVNALAEAAPGFVWRMVGEGGHDDPGLTVNLSVWTGLEALAAFAYRNREHRAVMRRRAEWFVILPAPLALWWTPAGRLPTLGEGMARLDLIARLGPSPEAFDFRTPFPAPA